MTGDDQKNLILFDLKSKKSVMETKMEDVVNGVHFVYPEQLFLCLGTRGFEKEEGQIDDALDFDEAGIVDEGYKKYFPLDMKMDTSKVGIKYVQLDFDKSAFVL